MEISTQVVCSCSCSSCSLTYCFSFFSVITTLLLVFLYSNTSIVPIPWYPFPFCSVIMFGAIISNVNCEAINSQQKNNHFGQHGYTIKFIYSFWFWSNLITLYSHRLLYPFIFVTLTLNVSLHSLSWIDQDA